MVSPTKLFVNRDMEVPYAKLTSRTEPPPRESACDVLAKTLNAVTWVVVVGTALFLGYRAFANMQMSKKESLASLPNLLKSFSRLHLSELSFLTSRFSIFMKNVLEMEEEERKMQGVDLEISEFADWADHELRRLLGRHRDVLLDGASPFEEPLYEGGVMRPPAMDWRDTGKVTPVKNQGQCGSCWAFAVVAAVESLNAIKRNVSIVSLSEQEMIDCDSAENGCRGGYRPYAMRFVQKNGLVPEQSYPYKAIEDQQCHLEQKNPRVFIDSYNVLVRNEETIADWVASRGPVTIGMNVTKAMFSYRSGIFNPSPSDCQQQSMGSHALTLVGYGEEGGKKYWVVKNSWGTSWGMNGYFRLARGVNSCGAANTVVAPVIN